MDNPEDDELTRQLDRDMSRAEWGPRLRKRTPAKKRTPSPHVLETLARVRVGTQLGGPNIRRCTATARHSGEPCKNPALRGEKVCRFHAGGRVLAKLRERRMAEGRAADRAPTLAKRNMRVVLKKNLLPYELLTNPQFQAVMKLVAPTWFGLSPSNLNKEFTREQLRAASLLSREYALAWTHAVSTGDWSMWANVVLKAREAGLGG